jgi:hypothetical protein
MMTDTELIKMATTLAVVFRPGRTCVAGEVAAAILTRAGRVYTGARVILGPTLSVTLSELLPYQHQSV